MVSSRSIRGLVCVTAFFAFLLSLYWSPDRFGFFHDDSIYWSSAKAMADGRGAVLPSVPGEPAQTKYPPFYPWLLSLVWRIWPVFPDNLSAGFWISALAGCVFLAGCFLLLCQLGLSEPVSLGLTAACALHPMTLILSSSVLSDMPFMALVIWACVGAWAGSGSTGETGEKSGWWWLAVVAALLAVAMRSAGVAVALGIGAFAVMRRETLRGLAVAGGGIAVVAAGVLWSWREAGPADFAGAANGFSQTMLYYTSYLGFWKLSVPDLETFRLMATFHFGELLRHPAAMTFHIPVVGFSGGIVLRALSVAVSMGIAKGLWTLARSRGFHPAVLTFVATLPIVIVWNFALLDRFLLPFLPLFLAGAYTEIRFVARSALDVLRSGKPMADRAIASILLGLITWLAGYGTLGYLGQVPDAVEEARQARERPAAEKREAYDWIRRNTEESDRFIAYQDAVLWLSTGRQAIRPMIFSPEAFYRQDEEILNRDLERFMDTAAAVGARYWLVAKDDFRLESAESSILEHVEALTAQLVPVFETKGSWIRVYDIGGGPRGKVTRPRWKLGGVSPHGLRAVNN